MESICNEVPLLLEICVYIVNICNETPKLQKYKFFIGNIGKEKSNYPLTIVSAILAQSNYTKCWLNISLLLVM